MQPMVGIQLSVFGKTLRERFLQMTGWILQPCSVRSQVPRFQCLLVDGRTPEWCEGDGLIPLGGSWTPSIGESPGLFSEEKESSLWRILEDSVPQKYYLSPAICSRFLRLAQTTGCPPPEPVEYLLIKQGGRYPSSAPFRNGVCGVLQNQETSLLSSQVSDGQMNLFQLCWQKQSI